MAVSVAYNPCPVTLTSFPVWDIKGATADAWVVNEDVTIYNAKLHLIGELPAGNLHIFTHNHQKNIKFLVF